MAKVCSGKPTLYTVNAYFLEAVLKQQDQVEAANCLSLGFASHIAKVVAYWQLLNGIFGMKAKEPVIFYCRENGSFFILILI